MPHLERVEKFKKRKKLKFHIPHIHLPKNFSKNIKYYYLGGFIFMLLLLSLIFFGPFFRVKNIEIIRKENITNINIAYKSVEDYRGKRLTLIDGKKVAESLKKYQKNIKEVMIKKSFPNTLGITIESYKGLYNTTINSQPYILTENGVLIPSKYSEGLGEIFIMNYNDIIGSIDYKDIFDAKYFSIINYIQRKVSENLITQSITSLSYFPIERELHIDFKGGTKIIFDLFGDPDEQIRNLAIFSKEQLKDDFTGIMYLDLRIKGKVFFCTTETEFQCKNNLKTLYNY